MAGLTSNPLLSLVVLLSSLALVLGEAIPTVSFAPFTETVINAAPVTLKVSFENSGSTFGFAPFVDVAIPTSYVVKDVSYLGMKVAQVSTQLSNACSAHAWAYDAAGEKITICSTQSTNPYEVVSVKVPFMSFSPAQTPAQLVIQLDWNEGPANQTQAHTFYARGGFEHGSLAEVTPSSDPSIVSDGPQVVDWTSSATLTSAPIAVSNRIITATGSEVVGASWSSSSTELSCNSADSFVSDDVTLSAPLPDCALVADWEAFGDGVSAVMSTPVATRANPNGHPNVRCTEVDGKEITCVWTRVVGTTKDTDVRLSYSYTLNDPACLDPRDTSGDGPPGSGGGSSGPPGTPRRLDFPGTVDYKVCDGTENCRAFSDTNGGSSIGTSSWLTVRSLAVQSSIKMRDDQGYNGYTPGDGIVNQATFQIGEYFLADDLRFSMNLHDGQALVGNPPKLTLDGLVDDVVPVYTTSKNPVGLDVVDVDIQATLQAQGVTNTAVGNLTGSFSVDAVILDQYLATQEAPRTPSVDHGQGTGHDVLISSTIRNRTSIDQVLNQVNDTAKANIKLEKSKLVHTIYAIDGVVCDPQPCAHLDQAASIHANERVTFRLQATLPSTDAETTKVTAFLPFPVFTVPDSVSFQAVASPQPPALNAASVGPSDTLVADSYPVSCTCDPEENAVVFDLGTIEDTANRARSVDVLFTLSSSTKPFADGLTISSMGIEAERGIKDIVDFVEVELLLPSLRIRKGAIFSSKPTTGFNPAGAETGPDGGIVTSEWLEEASKHYGASFTGIDGNDELTFVIAVWNIGRGKAYDVKLFDELPEGVEPVSFEIRNGRGQLVPATGSPFESSGVVVSQLSEKVENTAPGANVLIMSIVCRVKPDVVISSTRLVNTAKLLHYGSWISSPSFTGLNDDDDTAGASFGSPQVATTFTTSLDTTEFTEFDDDAHDLQIGEELYSHMTVVFPEGRLPDTRLTATAPEGLEILTATINSVGSKLEGSDIPPVNAEFVAGDGNEIEIDLGTVLNIETTNAGSTDSSITVLVTAQVSDIDSNKNGESLEQKLTVHWSTDASVSSGTSVDVVEPHLRLSCSRVNYRIDANDVTVVTYTVQHKGSKSNADAYNVQFVDEYGDQFVSLIPGTVEVVQDTTDGSMAIDSAELANGALHASSDHLAQNEKFQLRASVVSSNQTIFDTTRKWTPTLRYTNHDGTREGTLKCTVRLYVNDPQQEPVVIERSLHSESSFTSTSVVPVVPCEVVTVRFNLIAPEGEASKLQLRLYDRGNDDYAMAFDPDSITLLGQPSTLTFDSWEFDPRVDEIVLHNVKNLPGEGSGDPIIFTAKTTVTAKKLTPDSRLTIPSRLRVNSKAVSYKDLLFLLEVPELIAEVSITNTSSGGAVQTGDIVNVVVSVKHTEQSLASASNIVISFGELGDYAEVLSLASSTPGVQVTGEGNEMKLSLSDLAQAEVLVVNAVLRMTSTSVIDSIMPLVATLTYTAETHDGLVCANAPVAQTEASANVQGMSPTMTSSVISTSYSHPNPPLTDKYHPNITDVMVGESIALEAVVTLPRGVLKNSMFQVQCCGDRTGDFQLTKAEPISYIHSQDSGITFGVAPQVSVTSSRMVHDLGDVFSTGGTFTIRSHYEAADSGQSGDVVTPTSTLFVRDPVNGGSGSTRYLEYVDPDPLELTEPELEVVPEIVSVNGQPYEGGVMKARSSVRCFVTIRHTDASTATARNVWVRTAAPGAGNITAGGNFSSTEDTYVATVMGVDETKPFSFLYDIETSSVPKAGDAVVCGATVKHQSGTRKYTATSQKTAPVNIPPVTTDDTISARVGTEVVYDVLLNDIDVNGNMNSSTLRLTRLPRIGDASIRDGRLVFSTPVNASLGTIFAEYTVADDLGAISNTAVVSIVLKDSSGINNVVTIGDVEYAVIDNTPPDSTDIGCQEEPLSLPNGWSLAEDNDLARAALICHTWGTTCIILKDGTGRTSKLDSCGDPATNLVVNNEGTPLYGVGSCDARILISRRVSSPVHVVNPTFQTTNGVADKWSAIGFGYSAAPAVLFDHKFPAIQVDNKDGGASQTIPISVEIGKNFIVGVWAKVNSSRAGSVSISARADCADSSSATSCVSDGEYYKEAEFSVGTDAWQYRQLKFHTSSQSAIRVVTLSLKARAVSTSPEDGTPIAFFAAPFIKVDDGNLLSQGDWVPFELGYTSSDAHTPRQGLILPQYPSILVNGSSGASGSLTAEDDIYGAIQVVKFAEDEDFTDKLLYISGWSKSQQMVADTPLSSSYSIHVDVFFADGSARYGVIAPFTPNSDWHFSDGYLFVNKKVSHIQVVSLFNHPQGAAWFDQVSVRLLEGGCDAGVALAVGDPHLFTFDGTPYDLQLAGEFVLAKDKTFEAQARFSPAGQASVVSAVALSYNSGGQESRLTLARSSGRALPRLIVDDAVVDQSDRSRTTLQRLGSVGYITLSGSLDSVLTYVIAFPASGHSIAIEVRVSNSNVQYMRTRIGLPSASAGKVTGLFGNFDGDASNDLGDDLNDFGDSLRVSSSSSKFTYEDGESTDTYTIMSHGRDTFSIDSFDSAAVELARAECGKLKLSAIVTENCVYDVLVTQDTSFAEIYPTTDQVVPHSEQTPALENTQAEGASTVKPTGSTEQVASPGSNNTSALSVAAIVTILCVVVVLGIVFQVIRSQRQKKSRVDVATLGDLTDIRTAQGAPVDGPNGEGDDEDSASSYESEEAGTPLILRQDLPPLKVKGKVGETLQRNISRRSMTGAKSQSQSHLA